MIRTIALSTGFLLTAATIAAAQQAPTAPLQQGPTAPIQQEQTRTPTASTPGVAIGTTGTTFGTPGAMQMPTVPGGGIPQAAGTQDPTMLPIGAHNYNNSALTNSLDSSPFAPHRNGK